MPARALTAVLLSLSVGCESLTTQPAWPLAPLVASTPERRIVCDVTIERSGRTDRYIAVVEIGSARLVLAAFSLLGQPLFDVSYDVSGVRFDSALELIDRPAARALVADLELVHWPLDALAHTAEWTVVDVDAERRLLHRGSPVVIVRRLEENTTEIIHMDDDSRTLIRELEHDDRVSP